MDIILENCCRILFCIYSREVDKSMRWSVFNKLIQHFQVISALHHGGLNLTLSGNKMEIRFDNVLTNYFFSVQKYLFLS